MGLGIFGKIPQKRDFIAHDIPRPILEIFENWVQSGVAASKNSLGRGWQDHYMVAPIWRFWIGRSITGVECTGAIMPSVDQVGRFFPLSMLYYADTGFALLPPSVEPLEEWYTAIEGRLLWYLDQEDKVDVKSLMQDIEMPPSLELSSLSSAEKFKKGSYWRAADGDVKELLSTIGETDYIDACASRSFWWTNGGNDFLPAVFTVNGMPDAYFFERMITGNSG